MRSSTCLGAVALAVALWLVPAPGFAQGASSGTSLNGTVVDAASGVVPGVTVVITNNATKVAQTTTTNTSGAYSFPTLDPGTYTVTISLQGFKTIEVKEVRLLSGTPGNLGKATLQIGSLSETVEVKGATDMVRMQSPTVSSTVSTEFISSLPRSDRNVLSFLVFLPGVQTSGGAQNSRNSTIAGLPQNTINISIDGVTTSNLLQSGDGFFTLVTPRPDTVEEVTVSTAANGADTSMGATQVKFTTRSGTNQFNTSEYWYFKNRALNSNSFFNREVNGLDRPQSTTNDFGGRVGGPIMIPGLFDGHGKAFFFFNFEEIRTPNERSRSRTIIRDSALAGNFTFNNSSPRTINVLQLAADNGELAVTDPTVMALLAKIRGAASSTGNLQQSATSPNTETFNYQMSVSNVRHSPTGRVDVNLTSRHRLSGTYYWERVITDPDTLNNADPTFPGFPAKAGQFSFRTSGSSTLRSTFGSNLVNEALFGWQWSPVDFFGDSRPALFTDPRANQDGYDLRLGFGLTNAAPGNASGPQARNTVNWNIDDNVNWLKGAHSLKLGFSMTRISNWLENTRVVPRVDLGLPTSSSETALDMFTTANFATANSTDLSNARALYALLTGRVSSLPGTGQLNNAGTQYVFNGLSRDAERQDAFGIYASDSWRWKPNLTITAGLRYELQMPMVATVGRLTGSLMTDACGTSGLGNGVGERRCNLFQPGVFGNPSFTNATFAPLTADTKGYNLDRNNFGPNVGVNWRPMVQNGWLRTLFGDPEQATISGGFSRNFVLERVDRFRNVYVGNPGTTTPATRGFGSSDFDLCGTSATPNCPLLFSQKSLLTQPSFQGAPTFPLTALDTQDIFVFDPNIKQAYTDSWTVGLQRSINRDMAVEVRYVGNRNRNPWVSEGWNGANFRETGLLGTNTVDNTPNQFAAAQANLRANVAAGRGGTFAYFGPGTGTTPLPLFLAHFSGQPIASAGDQSLYNSTQWTNGTWVDRLDPFSPDPEGIAANLWEGSNRAWRNNAITNGGIYPANFWVMNPAVDDVNVTRNLGSSRYHSIQVDVRRRFAQGLQAQASYTFARGRTLEPRRVQFSSSNTPPADLHQPLFERQQLDNDCCIPHAFKMLWTWDLPVGRGRRFGTNMNGWLDGVIGGWQFSGSGRIQLPLFRMTNTRLIGMSHDEAQSLLKQVRIDVSPTGAVTVWDMPKDVVDNTIKAFSTDPRVAGYYSAGVPTGRYFAPAGRPAGFDGPGDQGCSALFAADCAPDTYFYGRWFSEFDFKLTKRFNLPGRAIFQMDAEVFNAFKATNFRTSFGPSASTNVFRITAQDSSARTGQLVWRITW